MAARVRVAVAAQRAFVASESQRRRVRGSSCGQLLQVLRRTTGKSSDAASQDLISLHYRNFHKLFVLVRGVIARP